MRNLIPLITATQLTWLATSLFFIISRGDSPESAIAPTFTSAISLYIQFNHIDLD